MVPSDPSMEDMKVKVVDEGLRPPLDPSWKYDEVRFFFGWVYYKVSFDPKKEFQVRLFIVD